MLEGAVVGADPHLGFPGSLGSRGCEQPVLLHQIKSPTAQPGSPAQQSREVRGFMPVKHRYVTSGCNVSADACKLVMLEEKGTSPTANTRPQPMRVDEAVAGAAVCRRAAGLR